ncbi:MAG: bifunctional UDP-N-acetylglucosamine diphosphorylase/glucosamine-1-phosphate N-acetyltransferase GlmU [Thermoflexales bacterium]|nr:bifunctional UDP-N-acetylglucosamine diphosphorylase/glucosamine-1-phosphate N-acetyltransferase GlmU [Thermoflexales bacterium]MDW8292736.1 bifunctional UDP-N-acetylglucosamine diphosphorylase/glucosamine-1-phosphate N-acetyltransferase GlmU [Anaerolineae bacterium]
MTLEPSDDIRRTTCAVVLAAGLGTRMKSALPKVLHPLCGMPLIAYPLRALSEAGITAVFVVHNPELASMQQHVGEQAVLVPQSPPLGTAHALAQAQTHAQGFADVVVLNGDVPLIRPESVRALVQARRTAGAAMALLTAKLPNPEGLGRILRSEDGARVLAIVEEVDCTPAQRSIREVNAGAYCFDGAWVWSALARVQPNSRKGEYFLTDLVTLANAEGRTVVAVEALEEEALGINTRVDLARAEAAMRRRINTAHMLNGVTLVDPERTYIEPNVRIAPDTVIWPNTFLRGNTVIGAGCEIGPNTTLVDAQIGQRVRITYSVIEHSRLEDDADAGPFAHIRGGARIGPRVHIGNFAEVKNSVLGADTKMGHFSYLGDAIVGEGVNIGAGTITCNYDGKDKHPTYIGDGAFIGSDTMLVAPVRVGEGAKTGAGAVVTRDVPPRTLALGVPARVVRQLDSDAA